MMMLIRKSYYPKFSFTSINTRFGDSRFKADLSNACGRIFDVVVLDAF